MLRVRWCVSVKNEIRKSWTAATKEKFLFPSPAPSCALSCEPKTISALRNKAHRSRCIFFHLTASALPLHRDYFSSIYRRWRKEPATVLMWRALVGRSWQISFIFRWVNIVTSGFVAQMGCGAFRTRGAFSAPNKRRPNTQRLRKNR